jgi:predicted Zn finger-like uncharacterized protein
MQLECPQCQNALTVPDSLRRYYDIPVRCHHCRHVFTIQKQSPRDDRGPAHDVRRPLDRSVSARHSHHMIVCQGCGGDLRVPGQEQRQEQGGPLRLACAYCLASFPYTGAGTAVCLDRVMIGLLVGIAAGCVVLWGHHEGYIELRNLLDGAWFGDAVRFINDKWLAGLRQMLADLFAQLRTAAMARLV